MTQTDKQILQINKLKWSVPEERNLREIEVSCFETNRKILNALEENFEADLWALERYI